ncbi:hypothetical protein PSTG_18012 [Puccinia striiformis f. sp. tritici PST-78]|uniref:Uncharacterized protein n=1 Tax=Puccinia striiformis f. sp. tritici PST-78 TaxID=1165861 RepID=A0A0L0UP79_9BASI|nr:hypothetical protein PSTG_18012 [Puccinia striiformis f. sp. tritici PST-78]
MLANGEQELNTNDRLKLIRSEIQSNIKKAFEISAKRYNLRTSSQKFSVGDLVYRRNFTLSKASEKYCAKLAPVFIKAKVVGTKGNSIYILRDEDTGKEACFHGKDIKLRNE